MMVSTKGRYALRVMIDLAQNQTDGYLPLKEIAARQNISEKIFGTVSSKYLSTTISSLVCAEKAADIASLDPQRNIQLEKSYFSQKKSWLLLLV